MYASGFTATFEFRGQVDIGNSQPGDVIHEADQKSWVDRQMRLSQACLELYEPETSFVELTKPKEHIPQKGSKDFYGIG